MKSEHLTRKLTEEEKRKISRMEIMKCIPKHCLKSSLLLSLYYGARDYACIIACYFLFIKCQQFSIPLWAQIISYIMYSFLQGFFWWCIFVVGHDCGHGTFSKYPMINAFMGHIFHGSIYVPFWPWALSHNRHHRFHNHKQKDYSNPWHSEVESCGSTPAERSILPLVAWPSYLIGGLPDGTHFFPTGQRLYKDAKFIDCAKCIVSSLSVFAWMFFYREIFGSWKTTAFFTLGPFIGSGYFLFTVTYFQHHGECSIVYDDENWNFEHAAFQTIDRSYGKFIDYFHHRITDCHVVHHLFFLSMPHYHLREATDALVDYLKKNDLLWLYQFESTRDFPIRVFQQVVKQGLSYKHYVHGKQHEE
jgi:omega-3 fatty acid desaturase (delta-15 desaturase)